MFVLNLPCKECIDDLENGLRAAEIRGEFKRLEVVTDLFVESGAEKLVGRPTKAVNVLRQVADCKNTECRLN